MYISRKEYNNLKDILDLHSESIKTIIEVLDTIVNRLSEDKNLTKKEI
jgi:hypothetical protein